MKNAIALFTVTLIVLFLFIPSYSKMQDLRKVNETYSRDIVVLEQEKARLKEELRRLQDDPVYLEKVAREKLGIARENEVVFKIEEQE